MKDKEGWNKMQVKDLWEIQTLRFEMYTLINHERKLYTIYYLQPLQFPCELFLYFFIFTTNFTLQHNEKHWLTKRQVKSVTIWLHCVEKNK